MMTGLCFFIMAVLMSSCATHTAPPVAAPASAPALAGLEEGQSDWRIPCIMHKGVCYISTRINGSPELNMVVDTGSGITALNTPVAKRLGLVATGRGKAEGLGLGVDSTYQLYDGAKVRLDDLELDHQQLISLSLDYITRRLHRRTDGTIGASLLKNFVVEMNFERSEIVFFRPGRWPIDSDYQVLPLEIVGGVPIVVATINGVSGRFVIDTGQIISSVLLTPKFKENAAIASITAKRKSPVEAVGGKITYSAGEIRSLTLGATEVKNLDVAFIDEALSIYADPAIAGGIGPKAFAHFDVIFDYPNKKLYFKRW